MIWSPWQYLNIKHVTTDLITEKKLSHVNVLTHHSPPDPFYFSNSLPLCSLWVWDRDCLIFVGIYIKGWLNYEYSTHGSHKYVGHIHHNSLSTLLCGTPWKSSQITSLCHSVLRRYVENLCVTSMWGMYVTRVHSAHFLLQSDLFLFTLQTKMWSKQEPSEYCRLTSRQA